MPNLCALVFCGPNQLCEVNAQGEPECVLQDDPCSNMTCKPGTYCNVDRRTQTAECKDICLTTKCPGGHVCRFNHDLGRQECVPELETPTLSPCSYLLCAPGSTCRVNDEGAAECVFNL